MNALKTVYVRTAIPVGSTDEGHAARVSLRAAPWETADDARTFTGANARALLNGNPLSTSDVADWFGLPRSTTDHEMIKLAKRGLLKFTVQKCGKRIWEAAQ